MNARKILSLFLAIVFAITTFATPVFAANGKPAAKHDKGKKAITISFSKPGNKNDNKGNKNNFKFSDSNEVEWATKAIEKLGIEGILSGISGDQFKPKQNVTELEALSMILNLTGNKTEATKYNSKTHPLYKGAKPTWGMGYLFLAIEKKILLPEELKGFNPNAPVKRHEVAKYIVRALGKTDEANAHMDEALDYDDASAIPAKSVGYVYAAADMGLMKANDNGEFQPMKPVTRAEMAVILDSAGGNVSTPGQTSKNMTFVSFDSSANKLTVKQNGRTYTYTVLPDAPVYVDGKYSSLTALKSGDVLQLVLNTSKQVIFIEVRRSTNDGNATDLGTQVSAVSVDYNSLPTVIQDAVNDLKDNENYKAFKYNGYIYLLAARGMKSTGGYDINIDRVYRYKNSDNDYTLNVKVSTVDPAATDMVTQMITYPYDVVRISYFTGIDSVSFLDKDNHSLAATTVSTQYDNGSTELGDELSVSRVNYNELPTAIQYRVDSLKTAQNYKAYKYDSYIYLISTMGEKNTEGYDTVIDSVYRNENSYNDYVLNVKVVNTVPASTDVVAQVKTYPFDVVRINYFSGIDSVRFYDGNNTKLAETTVYQQDAEQTVSGTVKSVNTSTRILEVQTSSTGSSKYIVSSSVPVTVNGAAGTLSNITANMTVKLTLVNSNVTSVVANDTVENLTGILTGISISTEKVITVKIGSSYKNYTFGSGTKVYIDGVEKDISDLRINNEVVLKLVNGSLTEVKIN